MGSPLADLVALSRRAHARGWTDATSGNFSARLDDATFAISASGLDKGALREEDLVVLGLGLDVRSAAPGLGPSAEAALHAALYRARPDVGAVAHTHSVAATTLSRVEHGDALRLSGYEMAKALAGVATHEQVVTLPVLPNSQDMTALAAEVTRVAESARHGFLVRGHGLYAVGRDVGELARHLEALEHMLACALHERPRVG